MATDPKTGLDIFGPINERTSALYTSAIIDELGGKIPLLNSIKLTIIDQSTGVELQPEISVISSFTLGALAVKLTPEQNRIVNQRKPYEDHIARFDYVYNNNESTGHHAILIRIRNLAGLV